MVELRGAFLIPLIRIRLLYQIKKNAARAQSKTSDFFPILCDTSDIYQRHLIPSMRTYVQNQVPFQFKTQKYLMFLLLF